MNHRKLQELIEFVGRKETGTRWSYAEVARRLGRKAPTFLYNAVRYQERPPTAEDAVALALLWAERKFSPPTDDQGRQATIAWLEAAGRPLDHLDDLIRNAKLRLEKQRVAKPELNDVVQAFKALGESPYSELTKACDTAQKASAKRINSWLSNEAPTGGVVTHFHRWQKAQSELIFGGADLKDFYETLVAARLTVRLCIFDQHKESDAVSVPKGVEVWMLKKELECADPIDDIWCFFSTAAESAMGTMVITPARLLKALQRLERLPGLQDHYIGFAAMPVPIDDEVLKTLLANRHITVGTHSSSGPMPDADLGWKTLAELRGSSD